MGKKHLEKPRKGDTRGSYITRLFNHLIDIGGYRLGTWITARLSLEANPGVETLKEIMKERLLDMPVFRSIAVANTRTSGFREVPLEDFDWEYHLSVICADEVVSAEKLQEVSCEIQSAEMDLKKPLWRVILVPELEEGGSVIFFVFNHSMADGMAGIGLLLKFVDDSPVDPTLPFNKQEQNESVIKKRKKKSPLSTATKVGAFFGGVRKGFSFTIPIHDKKNALKLKAKNVFDEKQYSGKKQFARSATIPLDEVKTLKNKFEGATVNDIFMAMLTITVKDFLQEKGDPILKKGKIRGSMPVSRRGPNEALLKGGQPDNNWEPLMLKLPLKYASPSDCVWRLKRLIDIEKVSPTLIVQRSLAWKGVVVGKRSMVIKHLMKSTTRASLMLSNVPGPQQTVHMGGVAVTDIDFMLNAPIGTYLGVFTYNGQVVLTVNGDRDCDYEAADIAAAWNKAFLELKADVEQYEGMVPKKVIRSSPETL